MDEARPREPGDGCEAVAEIRFEPVTPTIGAVVHGIDLQAGLDEKTAAAIHSALMTHLVLFFPGQDITPGALVAFARLFGPLEPRHPLYDCVAGYEEILIIENDAERPPDNEVWHADLTPKPQPPFGSVIQAKALPPAGGDTIWANMYAAYETLSEPLQAFLESLTAVHDLHQGFAYLEERGEAERVEALHNLDRTAFRACHPVVATHPATGRKLLNVNEAFTSHIVEVSPRESRQILALLFEHIAQPRFQVRYRWTPNAIAFWDNRSTQHFAVGDYYPHYRKLQRVTITEDLRAPRLAAAS